MNDEQFRELHQPLHVPAHFEPDGKLADRVVFSLADIGEGSAQDIINHFNELQQTPADDKVIEQINELLGFWDKNGLVTTNQQNGECYYNLHKITRQNSGSVNPRLLAPGLD